MDDMTIIYYTSNKEDKLFEKNIIQALLKIAGEYPIISVSHKPMKLGRNICVGDIGTSDYNCRMQMLIGAREAKTKYICTAESDFLYTREYLDFRPEKIACPRHLYVVWYNRSWFYRKWYSDGAMTGRRDYIIETIEKMDKDNATFRDENMAFWNNKIPLITFKTGDGMHKRTNYVKRSRTKELPYWGSIQKVKSEFICI
jgi:hypothetical protein